MPKAWTGDPARLAAAHCLVETMRPRLSELNVEQVKPILAMALAVPVLSDQELSSDFPVLPIGPIGLGLRVEAPRIDVAA